MKKWIFIIFLLPSIAAAVPVVGDLDPVFSPFSGRLDLVHSSTTLPSGNTNYIQNKAEQQDDAELHVSTGTFNGKLCFDTDKDTCFELSGDDLFLNVHGVLRQTWTTVQAVSYLLLDDGVSFIVLDDGTSKIIIQ